MNDPVNPAHYGGSACAEIGEQLSANSYQVLKYNWRLGKKDDSIIELRKSIWYLDRELELAFNGWRPAVSLVLPPDGWFDVRLKGQTLHVQSVAWNLIYWNRHHDKDNLHQLRVALTMMVSKLQGEV